MDTSAIIMMVLGCAALWGGCAVAVGIALKNRNK